MTASVCMLKVSLKVVIKNKSDFASVADTLFLLLMLVILCRSVFL